MKSLGIEVPDIITRVSEYVPEIIKFVERLLENGFAYEGKHSVEGNRSVYFHTIAYTNAGYEYGKLKPWAIKNQLRLFAKKAKNPELLTEEEKAELRELEKAEGDLGVDAAERDADK